VAQQNCESAVSGHSQSLAAARCDVENLVRLHNGTADLIGVALGGLIRSCRTGHVQPLCLPDELHLMKTRKFTVVCVMWWVGRWTGRRAFPRAGSSPSATGSVGWAEAGGVVARPAGGCDRRPGQKGKSLSELSVLLEQLNLLWEGVHALGWGAVLYPPHPAPVG